MLFLTKTVHVIDKARPIAAKSNGRRRPPLIHTPLKRETSSALGLGYISPSCFYTFPP